MKVKDATKIWLWVWTKTFGGWHYFPGKGKSACGRHRHPKKQPMAHMLGKPCKRCEKVSGKKF